MSERIHPTAVVAAEAKLHPTVSVGPGAVIEAGVSIGAHCCIGAHAVIHDFTRIGEHNAVGPHCVLGGLPQHTAYDGADTWVRIGDRNVLREYVTVHRAYRPGAETRIGSHCFLMTAAHVGHDCIVGDHVIMSNQATLGGHVEVGDRVVMGGMSAAHQFTRIGALCMVAAFAPLRKDALPYTTIGGTPVRHFRLNATGLRRNGIDGARYRALEAAFRALKAGDGTLAAVPDTPEVARLRAWLAIESRYGRYGFAAPGQRFAAS